ARMSFHRNAKLGLAGRYALVCAIEGGMTLKAAAAAFSVSPATAHRWWHRWQEASEEARSSLACLFDRSNRPRRSPRQLDPELAEAICACRRQTGWGPRLVAGATGFCHSTVWKVLKRAGISRPPRAAREPANRYEWPCPGDLLHMDVSRYARFLRPGHRVTGERSRTSAELEQRVGYDYVHAVVDDHSRIAFAEVLADERAATAHTASAPLHCHTGSTTTTERGHTARSEADPRSAAFTTCVGTTASQPGVVDEVDDGQHGA